MTDDLFLTPQLRKGPSSRLMKRRSQLNPPKLEATTFVQPEQMDVTTFSQVPAADMTANMTRVALSETMFMQDLSVTQQGIITPEGELIDAFLAAVCNEAHDFEALDQVAELEEILTLNIMSHKQGSQDVFDISALKQERNTWRLVGRLYHDELMQSQNEDVTDVIQNPLASEKEIVEHAFTTDKKLRRAQVIADWLEFNARKDLEDLQMKIPPPATIGWENTLACHLGKLKYRSNDLIKTLDPDAPARQNRNLHDLDNRDDHEFAKLLYVYVRSGMLQAAQEICEQSGYPWRAGTLDGWKLFHDPNLVTNVGAGTHEIKPTEGNLNRDLWKRVSLKMTMDAKMPLYFRAAYAALCGNINVLKSVCSTWEDLLWAYMRCLVDTMVEQRIREVLPKPLCELPAFYWNNKVEIDEVLDAVNSTNLNEDNFKEAKVFHEVQKYLILNQVEDLLRTVDQWSRLASLNEREILRFFAHLVLVLRRLDPGANRTVLGLECVRKYSEFLMETNHIQQVAWYVAQLRHDDQVDLYSQFLSSLSHEADKRLSLSLAVENSLPIHEILTQVVQRIHDLETEESADEITEIQLISRKIDAISWLLYDPKQMDEAVEKTNFLIRKLKATGKDESAQAAFDKLPDNAGDAIVQLEDLDDRQRLIVREYLSWSAYFIAKTAFDRWFTHYNKERPQAPKGQTSQHLTHKVTLEKQVQQYQIHMEQWKATQEALAQEAQEKLMAVLTFSEGWLAEPEEDEELMYLRKVCIPEVVLLCHTVLHTVKDYKAAMALADVVASEVHGLYECFHKENMRIFLNKIKQSAVCNLEQ